VQDTGVSEKILRGENLCKIYGKRMVVDHSSINVHKGEVVGLLGPNGAGKTTTFHMFTGMIRPSLGQVFINDLEVTQLPMYKRAQLGIGYLSQEPSVFRKLTVEQNLLLVLQTLGISKEEQIERLETLLDEPFVGVDPIAVEDIQKIVVGLKDKNIGVLITDHNVHETLSITDRSYLMFEGKILKSGTSEVLANDEDAKRLYLGDSFRLNR